MKLKLTLLVLLLATLLACSNRPQDVNTPTAAATGAPTNTAQPTEEAGGGEVPEAPVETTGDSDLSEEEEAEVLAVLEELINPPASAIPAPVDLQGSEAAEIFADAEYVRLLTFEGLEVPLCLQGNRFEEGAFLNGAVFMAECRNVTDQFWRATLDDNGYYTLQTLAHEADGTCLEGNVRSDGSALGGAAFLDGCAAVTGQDWKFVDRGDGTYRMQTQFLEADNLCFDGNIVDSTSVLQGASYMNDCAEVPGQIWIIEPVFDTSTAVEGEPVEVIDTRVIEPIVIAEEENTFLIQILTADGLCLEGSATPAGDPAQSAVSLVACSEAPTLLWQFVTMPDPAYYTLQTLASQDALKCLDSNNDVAGAPFDGAPFINDCSGDAAQNWRLIVTEDETPRIQSEASLAGNECLTVAADNTVAMETCQVDGGQAWQFNQTAVPVVFVPEGGPRQVAPDDLLAAAAGTVTGQALNALTGGALAGAEVCLQEPYQCTTADDAGNFTFGDVPAGEVTLLGSLAGYLDATAAATVTAGEMATRNVVMSPEMSAGGESVRVILTWGTAGDLDSYLRVPGDGTSAAGYVDFNAQGSADSFPFATLDKDDITGTGPETVTIEQQRSGTYAYFVNDLRGGNSLADATVQVYSASGLIAEFTGPSEPAYIWHVFNLDGETGEVQPVDAMVTQIPDASDPGFDSDTGDSSDGGAELTSLCADVPASTDTDVMVRFANTNDQTLYLYGSNAGNQLEQVAVIEPGAFHDQPTAQYEYWQIFDTEIDGMDEMERQTHLWTAYSVTEEATQCADLYSGISIADGVDACADIAALPDADVTVRFVNSSDSFQYAFLGGANGPQAQRVVNLRPGAYHDRPAAEGEAYQVYSQPRPWEADDPGVYQTAFHTTTAEVTQCVTVAALP